MKPEILTRAFDAIVPRVHLDKKEIRMASHSQKGNANRIKTGTTIMVFYFSDGIIFAGDRKTSTMSLRIISLETIKIYELAPYVAMGGAGLVSDIQYLVDLMTELNHGFVSKFENPLSIRGQANFLAGHLRDFRYYVDSFGLEASFIIGGINLENKFSIFEVYEDGSQRSVQDYSVIGSGTDGAMCVLREKKKELAEKKLGLEESIDLAVKAIHRAAEIDNGTSDIRVAHPTIFKITSKGFEAVDGVTIGRAVERLIEKDVRNG